MMPRGILLGAAALLCSPRAVESQIHILAPEQLVHSIGSPNSQGWIMGATSTFGAPFFGDRVIGRLVYGRSETGMRHCTPEDYTLPELPTAPSATGEDSLEGSSSAATKQLLRIAVVLRGGGCSITTKVKVAQDKGAHAVIIVDKEDSKLTAQDMGNVLVADDGFGDAVHVPSVFISKEEGDQLIHALTLSPVVVELQWKLPQGHAVKIDWWLSSASRESYRLLKEFAPKRRALNEVMNFQPHYAVFGVGDKDSEVSSLGSLCMDGDNTLCAEDPDGSGQLTGVNVLHENVRQLCIHEVHKVPDSTSVQSLRAGKGSAGVQFAEKFWAYIEKFVETCPLDGWTAETRFGLACSVKLMRSLGIDQKRVDECVIANTTKYLERERNNPAWSSRALRINGWRYSGLMDADLITRAICSGFLEQPKECQSLVKQRNPMEPYVVTKVGYSLTDMLLLLLVTGGVMTGLMMLYKRQMRNSMLATVREEVILEVQAQLSQYQKMQAS